MDQVLKQLRVSASRNIVTASKYNDPLGILPIEVILKFNECLFQCFVESSFSSVWISKRLELISQLSCVLLFPHQTEGLVDIFSELEQADPIS